MHDPLLRLLIDILVVYVEGVQKGRAMQVELVFISILKEERLLLVVSVQIRVLQLLNSFFMELLPGF